MKLTTTIKSVIILIIFSIIYIGYGEIKRLQKEIDKASVNIKAYQSEMDNSNDQIRQYKFTINDLKNQNDSIINELLDVSKELKIKDKQIASLQYIKSTAIKLDTLFLPQDTIFVNDFKLDTIIGNKWFNTKLHLEYPSKIILIPSYLSEKIVVTKDSKEYIDTPKKFFIARWFQKKHIVRTIHIKENNPYTTEEYSKFIEIIK